MHSSYDALEVDLKGNHFCQACSDGVENARQARPVRGHAVPAISIAAV